MQKIEGMLLAVELYAIWTITLHCIYIVVFICELNRINKHYLSSHYIHKYLDITPYCYLLKIAKFEYNYVDNYGYYKF